ncbi:MAG: phosphocholine cytidylyltransferase family protein [Gammaproteobacteria bacterium]
MSFERMTTHGSGSASSVNVNQHRSDPEPRLTPRDYSHPGVDLATIQAVILAAGRGSRLKTAIDNGPKCLANVGGRPLIDHQLFLLAQAGIRRVAVVTGYGARAVRAAVGDRAGFIHNRAWAKTNSLYSLQLCREWVTGSLVVMNCDVLPHPGVLRRLLECPGNAFAYDSSSGTENEHMKVELEGEYLNAISKQLVCERCQGENVGILYFEKRAARLLFREAEALLGAGGKRMWVAAAVQEVARYVPLRAIDVADLCWIEIDFPQDLQVARSVIWPRISRSIGPAPAIASRSAARE